MAEAALAARETPVPVDDLARYRLFDLYKEIRYLMGQRHAIEYRLSCLLRELDQREQSDGRPLHLATWLAHSFALGYGAARERVRTARALGHLPLVDAAFRNGTLSYSKVRALTRVATSENEAELLAAASRHSTEGVEQVVRRLKQRERLDDVQEMLRQRSLTYAWDEDGSLVVKARLTPEQGAIWLQALHKVDDELERDNADDYTARQADAITHALEESLNGKPKASKMGDRYQVVVHVSAETFSTDASDCSKPPYIENGPILHPETVKRLACDGALVSLLENDRGEVLNVGRKTRVIPSAIQRALKARDQTCRYPGCSHTRYVDGHHIVHWSEGGETKLDNLILLCRRHQRLVHEYGFRVVRSDFGIQFAKVPRTDPRTDR